MLASYVKSRSATFLAHRIPDARLPSSASPRPIMAQPFHHPTRRIVPENGGLFFGRSSITVRSNICA